MLLILFWLQPAVARPQIKDSLKKVPDKMQPSATTADLLQQQQNTRTTNYKPEIFTSGFIDIINSGQVNASVRFIRLFIGEPGKFSVPVSLYSGVSSNNFQNTQSFGLRSNDMLVTSFINPLSGLANVSTDGVIFFKKKTQRLTIGGLLYHLGIRILTGVKTGPVNDPGTGNPINFLNTFGSLGYYFQTGAWERNNAKNVGVFWFVPRYIGCYTFPGQLKEILPGMITNGFYHGYSLGWGVEISNLVNIRVVYYRYVKKPEINYYLPIYQFSFNYTLKK